MHSQTGRVHISAASQAWGPVDKNNNVEIGKMKHKTRSAQIRTLRTKPGFAKPEIVPLFIVGPGITDTKNSIQAI
jgi:hypothetical protein